MEVQTMNMKPKWKGPTRVAHTIVKLNSSNPQEFFPPLTERHTSVSGSALMLRHNRVYSVKVNIKQFN